MIRRATTADIPRLIELLHQVNGVHHCLRPDLFKPHTTKYSEPQLDVLLTDDNSPVFVYADTQVVGYAFCRIIAVNDDRLLQDMRTLYIDDLCVDQSQRGRHVGKALFDYVREYARIRGCYNITLNVWEGNTPAKAFYQSIGMHVQKTGMEIIL